MKTRLKGGSEYEFNTFGDGGVGVLSDGLASIDRAAKAFADRKQEEQEAEAKRKRAEFDDAVAMAGAAARARKAEAETRIKATAARMTSSIRDEAARRTGPIRRRLRYLTSGGHGIAPPAPPLAPAILLARPSHGARRERFGRRPPNPGLPTKTGRPRRGKGSPVSLAKATHPADGRDSRHLLGDRVPP